MLTICCILKPRVLSSFLSWKNLLWEKQKVAKSKLNGTACNKLRHSWLWAMNVQNQCDDCGKEFSSPLCFYKHFYHQKNESNCNVCERKFHNAYILKKAYCKCPHNWEVQCFWHRVAEDVLARHKKNEVLPKLSRKELRWVK